MLKITDIPTPISARTFLALFEQWENYEGAARCSWEKSRNDTLNRDEWLNSYENQKVIFLTTASFLRIHGDDLIRLARRHHVDPALILKFLDHMKREDYPDALYKMKEIAIGEADNQDGGGRKGSGVKPALSENAQKVYAILKELAPHESLTGPKILDKLAKGNVFIDQSTLTTRIIPELKLWGVVNTPRKGYRVVES